MKVSDSRLIVSFVTQDDYAAMEIAARDLDANAIIQQTQSFQELIDAISGLKDPTTRPILLVSSKMLPCRLAKLVAQVQQASLFLPMIILREHESSSYSQAPSSVVANPFNSVFLTSSPVDQQAAMDVLARANHLADNFFRLQNNVGRFSKLSEREIEIVRMATEGLPNKSIARRLDVSIKTVEKNRRTAYEKLEVASAAEMASVVTFHRYCLPITDFIPTTGASLLN